MGTWLSVFEISAGTQRAATASDRALIDAGIQPSIVGLPDPVPQMRSLAAKVIPKPVCS